MDTIGIVLTIYVLISFLWVITVIFFRVYLINKYTDRVINLLKMEGFTEVAERLESIVKKIGKFGLRGFSGPAREHRKAWKEFRTIDIPKEKRELYKIQKVFIIDVIINNLGLIILCIIPCFSIVYFILYTIIFM